MQNQFSASNFNAAALQQQQQRPNQYSTPLSTAGTSQQPTTPLGSNFSSNGSSNATPTRPAFDPSHHSTPTYSGNQAAIGQQQPSGEPHSAAAHPGVKQEQTLTPQRLASNNRNCSTPNSSKHSEYSKTPVGTPTHKNNPHTSQPNTPLTPASIQSILANQASTALSSACNSTMASPAVMQLTADALAAKAKAQALQAKAEAAQAAAAAAQAAAVAASSLPPNSPLHALLSQSLNSPLSNYNPTTPNTPSINNDIYSTVLSSPLASASNLSRASLASQLNTSQSFMNAMAALNNFNTQPGSNNSHSSGIGAEPSKTTIISKFPQFGSNQTSGKGDTSSNVSPGSGNAVQVDSGDGYDSGNSPKVGLSF